MTSIPCDIPCDIVILPSPELSSQAISVSEQLQPLDTLYVLEEGKCFPHVSLYMTQLKVQDLEKAKQLLAELANNCLVINLTAGCYHQAEGFIDAEYERTAEINQLQREVIGAINPMRDGMREKDRARIRSTTGLTRKNLETYGYRAVGDLFQPHLSLARFKDPVERETGALPSYSVFSGRFSRLGIFEMGDNGTCVRRIAEFDFNTP